MLDLTRKNTYQDSGGYSWIFYADDTEPEIFYIVPRPDLLNTADGRPSFQLVSGAPDPKYAGQCRFEVGLSSIPAPVQQAIALIVSPGLPSKTGPVFSPIPASGAGTARFTLSDQTGGDSLSSRVSRFGQNAASFFLPLNAEQLAAWQALMSAPNAVFGSIEYQIPVPARLPDVEVVLKFNSALAYLYRLNQPAGAWDDLASSTGILKLLTASASSIVQIDPATQLSSDLEQAIKDWANTTLLSQVEATFRTAMRLQGVQNGKSLDLSAVQSFALTYQPHTVVDWIITSEDELRLPAQLAPAPANVLVGSPTAAPDVPTDQMMTVCTALPFKSASTVSSAIPLVDHVNVTVRYPISPLAGIGTYTFTASGSQLFSADYLPSYGPSWSLDYEVFYAGSNQTVSGSVTVEDNTFTIGLDDAGIFNVTFDATQAFATETAAPNAIHIEISYMDTASDQLVQLSATINRSDDPQTAEVSDQRSNPIAGTYNYQVTYIYDAETQYRAPLQQMNSDPLQLIPAAAAAHATNLLFFFGDNGDISAMTLSVWYLEPPALPLGVNSAPTSPDEPSAPSAQSPAVFQVTAGDCVNNTCLRTFYGFLNGDRPLVYSAVLELSTGPLAIADQLIENDQASLMISPTQRYFTVAIDDGSLDWSNTPCESVEVLITATITQGSASTAPPQPPQRAFTWNKNETGSRYVTYPILVGNGVTYDWKVNYLTPADPITSLSGSKISDTTFKIPPIPAH